MLSRHNEGLVAVCPQCLSFWAKENKEECDRLICSECHTKFMACCSAYAEPIEEHDTRYHRPSCWKYPKMEINEEPQAKKKCPFCKGDTVCKPPADLEDGDIPEHEQKRRYL